MKIFKTIVFCCVIILAGKLSAQVQQKVSNHQGIVIGENSPNAFPLPAKRNGENEAIARRTPMPPRVLGKDEVFISGVSSDPTVKPVGIISKVGKTKSATSVTTKVAQSQPVKIVGAVIMPAVSPGK